MCGIIGINHLKKADIDHSLLYKATSFLRHRGPDDEGYLLVNKNHKRYRLLSGPDSSRGIKRQFPGITAIRPQEGYDLAFGFRRLSILDLSDRGHQPMGYKNNWIVYNGEVFNYQEIRDELKEKGYSFKTRTDTEVVLAAYHRWGRDCVLRFNGQWAFCIYDSHNDLLFCSRDRFGIIPFYFYKDDNTFAFASEIKSLLSFPFVKRSVNEDMIFDFLVFGLLDH
ncbi:MAG: asparagine synthetase B, partial [Spirochaetes bacterium]|nr:asparagine synthetase B [Spirochaetota bacterium]